MKLNEVVVLTPLTGPDESNEQNNKFVQTFVELFEKDDFFSFQKLIDNYASSSLFCFCFDKNQFSPDLQKVLEIILKNSDNKSAAYISLIWHKFKLWNDKKLNTTIVSNVRDSTNIRTLFSLLMFDWHNPDQCNDEAVFYFLVSKFKQYEEATAECLFTKLYTNIDAAKYKSVCLRIIYQFLDELNNSSECKDKIFGELEHLMKINEVLKMIDIEFKKKILKVFVAYWYRADGKYKSEANKILIERLMEISPFFELAFMLKEKQTSTFEKKFLKYLENCKRKHGFYYKSKLKLDNRLLLHIAEQNKMTQIRSFIFRKCPFNEINATPLTNVQEISKILNLNIYPWTKREVHLIVSLQS